MLDEAPPLMGCSATAAEADIKAEFAGFFKSATGFASLHPTMMAGALVKVKVWTSARGWSAG
jgi:hypothetical protein